jgi:predicted nucleic acid-binding protein
MPGEFCDTNVIVYAYDRSDRKKQDAARELLDRMWADHLGVVSIQVLQELYVTLTRRTSSAASREVVADLAQSWRVIEPQAVDVLAAIDHSEEWQLSFWDAMVLTTAAKADARIVWSEDLQDGREYGGVRVFNPFRRSTV